MGTYYWIKLWLEMLDDPKIGTLPDWAYRRWIECLLVAREYDRCGLLPPVSTLAWRLRLSEEKVREALRAFAQIGVARETADGWLIVHFTERQSAVSDASRSKQYRDRQKAAGLESVAKSPDLPGEAAPTVTKGVMIAPRAAPPTETETETETEPEAEEQRAAEAEAKKPPGSSISPEWPEIPDAMTVERIFQKLTSMVTFPGRTRDSDIERLCAIYDRHKAGTLAYLLPFWQAWNQRGYHRVNTGWLDWAISGQIPPQHPGKRPPRLPVEDIGTDDPAVVSAYHYLKLNPRGKDRQGAMDDLAEKGYRYEDGRLVRLESPG
jgi:hypothetical protein